MSKRHEAAVERLSRAAAHLARTAEYAGKENDRIMEHEATQAENNLRKNLGSSAPAESKVVDARTQADEMAGRSRYYAELGLRRPRPQTQSTRRLNPGSLSSLKCHPTPWQPSAAASTRQSQPVKTSGSHQQ